MTGQVYPAYPLTPYPRLIVNAALTGMVPLRPKVPYVPLSAADIVADAVLCARAGASILHLHARDAEGAPEWRREGYEAFIPAIREACPDVVICVTTSGRTFGELERRADALSLDGDAKPDMASLTLGSLNFRDVASVNAPAMIEALAARMLEAGIKAELEIFDTGMAYLAHSLLDRGLLEAPLYANLLLGSPNTAPARAADLAALVGALPAGTVWAAAGIGAFQLPINAMAVFMGGHVRTGLEDNPHLHHTTREPATNAALVTRVAELAATAGRKLATPAEVRALLGLRPATHAAPALRPAVPADREALRGLAGLLPGEREQAAVLSFEHGLSRWHVAEDGGEIVAASTVLPRPDGSGVDLLVTSIDGYAGHRGARALTELERDLEADRMRRSAPLATPVPVATAA